MELKRDAPLYDRTLFVKIPTSQHDIARDVPLTFRILQGVSNNVLHFELTDDNDPYFLYLLELSEHDFPTLKREQSILVDFNAFPSQLIELLKLVTDDDDVMSSTEPMGAPDRLIYSVKMDLNTGQFSILENNRFKQTTHITLQLRPGNDAAIKAYLASRLHYTFRMNHITTKELEGQKEALRHETELKHELMEELVELRKNRDLDLHSTRNAHAEEVLQIQSKMSENHEKVTAELQAKLTQWMLKHDETSTISTNRIRELESSLQEERGKVAQNEFKIRELERNQELHEKEREKIVSELADMHHAHREAETARSGVERELVKIQMRNEALEVQLKEKDTAMGKSVQLQKAHEEARKSGEEQLELYRSSLEAVNVKLVTAVSEIKKGNVEISRQQQEIAALKDKANTKSEVIRKQEALVVELRSQLSDVEKCKVSLESTIGAERNDALTLRKELEKAKERLEESASIISTNQEVITWLNREISRYQISGGVGPLGNEMYLYEGSPSSVMATETPTPPTTAITGQYKGTNKPVTADSKLLASYDYLKKNAGLKGLEGIVEIPHSGLDVTGLDDGDGYYAGLFGSESTGPHSHQKSISTTKMY